MANRVSQSVDVDGLKVVAQRENTQDDIIIVVPKQKNTRFSSTVCRSALCRSKGCSPARGVLFLVAGASAPSSQATSEGVCTLVMQVDDRCHLYR